MLGRWGVVGEGQARRAPIQRLPYPCAVTGPVDTPRPADQASADRGHRVTLILDGLPVETLADLPPEPGRLLFVGLNPSPVSVAAGHYHQGRLGRTFWRRLVTAGVLPAGIDLERADDALVGQGHGITDMRKVPTPRDTATEAELRAGVGRLWQKAALWRPAAIVFVYKRAAEACAGHPVAEPWGHLEGLAMAARPCFLMPGPYASREAVDEGLNVLRNLLSAISGRGR
jgi:double-stranded uracil-DNA glycosylase